MNDAQKRAVRVRETKEHAACLLIGIQEEGCLERVQPFEHDAEYDEYTEAAPANEQVVPYQVGNFRTPTGRASSLIERW